MIQTQGVGSLYKGLSAGLLRQATYTTARLGIYNNIFEAAKKHNDNKVGGSPAGVERGASGRGVWGTADPAGGAAHGTQHAAPADAHPLAPLPPTSPLLPLPPPHPRSRCRCGRRRCAA